MKQRHYLSGKTKHRKRVRWLAAAAQPLAGLTRAVGKSEMFRRLRPAGKPRSGRPDLVLLGTIGVLLVVGVGMLTSASSVLSFQRFGEQYYYVRHQLLFGLLPGSLFFFFFYRFPYQRLQRYSLLLLLATVGFLVLVFIPGLAISYGRTQSWVSIAGFSFQPSELAKLTMILFLAAWFAERGPEMNRDFRNGLIPFAVLFGLISIPIVLQPDLGTLSVVTAIAMAMYFTGGGRLRHIFGLVALGVAGIALVISRSSYMADRLLIFLHPERDPLGIGYHINQAFIAVGSGGLLGLGYGQSRQKFAYLPEVMGDSIFAVIAEELGFFLAAGIVAAFLVLMLRGIRASKLAPDQYGSLAAIGIVAWFSAQAFANISAMIGLMPLTGIPLPLISYGGTALVAALAGLGILCNISRQGRSRR